MEKKWTEEQVRAIESFGHDILVSAGAGSGKTAVLSERVYRIVGKRKIDVDRLLVLTFTNKAAVEMKLRIRQTIMEDHEGLFSEEEKRRQVNKLDSSFIMTFDAYALFLVKKYHYLLNIDKDVSIIDANILIDQREKILDELFLNHYRKADPSFLEMVSVFCIKDDRDLRDAVLKTDERLDTIYERKAYVENYSKQFYGEDALNRYLKRFEAYLLQEIRQIRRMINEFSESVENVSDYFIDIDSLIHAGSYHEIEEACKTCEMSGRKLPKGSGVSELKKGINDRLIALKKLAGRSEEEIRREISSTEKYDRIILGLCKELHEGLAAFKRKSGQYSFNDIFRMAIDLIEENEEIRKEISEGFDEILIDEYQDTNDLQEGFIRRIARDNVYMVGDVKQSIYRFRNANPAIFMNRYLDFEEGRGGELITLPHNFRSRSEIIGDINVIFDRLMDPAIGGAAYRRSHHMAAGRTEHEHGDQNQRLEILNYEYDKKVYPFTNFSRHEAEAFILAEDIRNRVGSFMIEDGDKIRPAEYRDFCIIVDRTTNFDLYKQVLTYFDIPSIIEKDEKMSDSDLIYALKAAFALVEKMAEEKEDENFVFSYVSLARSFLVEMRDEEIYDIVKAGSFMNTDLCIELSPLAKRLDAMSIAQVLDEIIEIFDVYGKLIRIGDVRENLIKIDYLYQLAHTLNRSGYDCSSFNGYLDALFKSDDDERDITYAIDQGSENAVKIINIHKAKGLQYKICYFPALDVDFNLSDIKDRFIFTKDDGIILPVYIENRGLKDSIRKILFVDDYLKADIGEKMRLLYVGLTRSQEKMIMIASLRNETEDGEIIDEALRVSYRSYCDMLNDIYADLDENGFIKDLDLNDYLFSKDYRILRKRNIASLIDEDAKKVSATEEPVIEPAAVRQAHFSKDAGLIDAKMIERMELGTRLHYYLETLDFKDPDLSGIEEKYLPFIRNFLNSEIMKDAKDGKAYKEYEFIYEEDGERKHGFIDLLMEYDDHFDIIDYKTKNIDDQHYDEQLNGYRNYIKMISDKKVCCYLYSIVDSIYREVTE